MAEERVQRRLAAILAADVVGYSRLMGKDEAGTRARFNAHLNELIERAIANRQGRIVKTIGDGLLVELASVVEAVQCAVDIQMGMAERNKDEPDDRRIDFRIGVNLGDVIVEGDDIHGDGVNVAARLEALADPGGVCISGSAFEQVRDKLEFGFEDLGHQQVKNIVRPVRTYRLLIDPNSAGKLLSAPVKGAVRWKWPAVAAVLAVVVAASGIAWGQPWAPDVEPASVTRMAWPLPDKPSIAVLPFNNLSGDPSQGHLGDGLAENIIASLSKIPQMFVISRNSTFTYKGKPVKVQQVAEELGVRYVLEGSVQRSGAKARITAQLIDALTGHHLWSERYDRDVNDIFAFQDEITLKVVTALQVELTDGDLARVRQKGTKNLDAWLLVTQAAEKTLRLTKEDNAKAKELAKRAIALDGNYTQAYTALAWSHLLDFQAGWATNRAKSFKRSVELVQQALKLDDTYSRTYTLLGNIHLFINQHDQAIAYTKKAIDLSPNDSSSIANLAMIQSYAGEPGEAIVLLRKAMRLSPFYPDWFLSELGRAYFLTGQYDEAIDALKLRLRRDPNSGDGQILLAASYGAVGRQEEAQAALAEFVKPRPYYTLKHYAKGEFYKNPEDLKRVLDGLRKAGLPE